MESEKLVKKRQPVTQGTTGLDVGISPRAKRDTQTQQHSYGQNTFYNPSKLSTICQSVTTNYFHF